MSLSKLSIRKPVFAWMVMFAMILFGLIGFKELGINENPDVDYPTVTVNYVYEGATPAVVEKDVLEPAESILVSMEGIRNLSSQADRGNGVITLEFELNRDIDLALQEVQTLLGRAQPDLPDSVAPPSVVKNNASDDPIMYLALSSNEVSTRELMLYFRDKIRDRLSTIEGVAEVRALGYHEPMMRIDLIEQKLNRYQLSAIDVVESIRHGHLELPAGRFDKGDGEKQIRVLGEGQSVQDFENMIISRRGGAPSYVPLKIKDVANVYEGIENIRRISRGNGEFSLGMGIFKQRGSNEVKVADNVFERVDEINKTLPKDMKLHLNFDRSRFVRASVDELVSNLIYSAILTALVCWLFLKSFSSTINIFLAIPTAVIGSFAFMSIFGFTLNTFSLLGLSLAIGIVVDDAIVMLENIVRYRDKGYHRVRAAFLGSKEITFAVIATTLALIAIFSPITLMKGIEGKFFFEFALTLCIAVSLSSLEALTLTPMRCSQFLDNGQGGFFLHRWVDEFVNFLRSLYLQVLEWSLRYKWLVLGFTSILFIASLSLLKIIPSEFAPAQDRGVLFLIIRAPQGKSFSYTDRKIKDFENYAMAHPAVRRVYLSIGGFGQGGQGNQGNGVIILKDRNQRDMSQDEVTEELRKIASETQGLNIFIRNRFGSVIGGRRGSPIEFTIKGPDLQVQRQIYTKIEHESKNIPGLDRIRSDDVLELPEVHIVPDRVKAKERGVEIAEIARTINVALGGVTAAEYTQGGRRFDLFVQLQQSDRENQGNISPLYVRNNRGELVRLRELVKFEHVSGPQKIFRENRERGIRIDGDLATGAVLGPVLDEVKAVAQKHLEPGYRIDFSQDLDDTILGIVLIILLGLAISYMVMGSQFNSFVDPLVVFLAIPFGLSGSLLSLYWGGQSLNVYSLIGILLTMGLVKKNSILLVEFSNQLRDQGVELSQAVREAARLRFRPILMTTLATMAAAVPAVVSRGPGSETRIPMGLVVLGGVATSVIFTLVIIPIVYQLLASKRYDVDEHLS